MEEPPQFIINLIGVQADTDDYVGYLKRPNGHLVFIQHQDKQTATLLARDDGNWVSFEVVEGRSHLPLLDDRDQLWLGVCWHHSSGLRPEPDPPAKSAEDYMRGRTFPPIQTGICKHCQQPIRALKHDDRPLRWTHGNNNRGCRAASFRAGSGWDESLDRKWLATPTRT